MLRPRIIPCLLIHDGGLAKTVQFADPKYVGDPINTVRIFNEKEVDELIVLDIDATVREREPAYDLIENLAAECRMPLCYGGGVKTVDQVDRIIGLGVEKVAISSAAVHQPQLVRQTAAVVGSQSIVVALDIKQRKWQGGYEIWTHNAQQKTEVDPIEFARHVECLGAGEILINAIDRDGIMRGYNLELVRQFHRAVGIPITALGGAGSPEDLSALIESFGPIGAAAGSLFVFKGVYRAVLINYPDRTDKDALAARAWTGDD